jgi:hypothetical protein
MGFFRFRRTFGLIPGFRLNLGKKSVSVSSGIRGLHYTVGTAGKRLTAGLPGTGLAYTSLVPSRPMNEHETPLVSGGTDKQPINDLGQEFWENAKGRFSDTAIAIARVDWECIREGRNVSIPEFARFGVTPDQLAEYGPEAEELLEEANVHNRETHRQPGFALDADLEDKALENAKGRFSDTAIALARMTWDSQREGKVLELSDLACFGLTPDQMMKYLDESKELMNAAWELVQDHTPRKFQFVPVGSVEQEFLENAKGQFSDTAIAIARMAWECRREGKDPDVTDEARFGITPDQIMQYGDEAAELIRAANAQYRDKHRQSGLGILLVVGLLAVLAVLAWAAWQATRTPPAPSAPATTTAVPQPAPLPKSAPLPQSGAIRTLTPLPRPSDTIDPWSGIARPAPLPRPGTKPE